MPNETLAALRESFADATLTSADPGYDEAKATFNLLVDQSPGLVARPSSADEAAAIVDAARAAGARVAPQGSTHGAGALAPLDDAVLVRFEQMAAVDVDTERRIARVEAGARWRDVIPKLSEHGLTALHGYAGGINVVGYTLSGGIGWLVRKHGLQTNAVTAFDVVTADGSQQRVDADSNSDLFWALRGGGGGNFALVTAVEFGLVELSEIYAGALVFPYERAGEVAEAWREWTATAPEEFTTTIRLTRFPPMPEVPEPFRGKAFTMMFGAYIGDPSAADDLLAPLRELGPEMDNFATVPAPTLATMTGDPPGPVPAATMASLVGELSASGLEEILAAVGPAAESSIAGFELRHLGGAAGREAPDAGALAKVNADFTAFAVAPIMAPETLAPAQAHLARVEEAIEPHSSGKLLAWVDEPCSPERAYGPDVLARLREIKAAVDPEGLFLPNQSIG